MDKLLVLTERPLLAKSIHLIAYGDSLCNTKQCTTFDTLFTVENAIGFGKSYGFFKKIENVAMSANYKYV